MTRCDYDAVFYRVFCVTLLAIAFTFTVILTNVFIDIDGLLASKKDRHDARTSNNIIRDEFTSEATDKDDLNYEENEDSYRTKRSVETQSYLFHIKNPKVKNILTNRLQTLLEELDAEESEMRKEKKMEKETKSKELVEAQKFAEDKIANQKNDEMLHLTMHNIILQGIIGHMDMHNVYKKVNSLMSNYNEHHDKKEVEKSLPGEIKKLHDESKILTKPVEERFFEELLNCKELQNQIGQSIMQKAEVKKHEPLKESPNVLIKTVIDITSKGNEKIKENDTKIPKENIKGVVELVYNGKIIKFTRPDVEIVQTPPQKTIVSLLKPKTKVNIETTTVKEKNDVKTIPKSYLDKFIEEYFKHFPLEKESNNEIKEKYATINKRLKRHVKITSLSDSKELTKKKNKAEEDELYVEIETHFDSKGMKGEKKKKLIRSLIEKIQKAIHSDMDGKLLPNDSPKENKHKQLHFRKRLQNPLDHKNHVLINKFSVPISGIIHRQLDPISKTVRVEDRSPYIGSKGGNEWKKPCFGPGFLSNTKAINSAELSEVDVNYSKILDVNGIPQRIQKPLNTELSEETISTNSYYDVGKMKFFIKDIDGSGFSVGFNQYVDEPPDAETMRLFTGLENVLKTYHQNYDPSDAAPLTESPIQEKSRETSSMNNEHILVRRSINQNHDYHSNEYKIIYDNNYMPYNDYRDIFESKKYKKNLQYSKRNHYNKVPLIVDDNIFDKNLKPGEIFGLASLLERKKRSINVKKISNLKNKIKLNRYLNTKAMSTKRIFLNKKRNKRQINKIRIIASDLPHVPNNSEENIFVVSDENVFADRAIVKEVETSEGDHDKQDDTEYIPYQSDDSLPSTYVTKIFDARSRHNPLMSKYPHIFMEEISRSREEYIPDNALLFGKIPGIGKLTPMTEDEKPDDKVFIQQVTVPPLSANNNTVSSIATKEQDIVNALMVPPSKANYKVTVKILPKNMTGLNSGFKEIHTSINKRFNKNGLLYSSLVNVSEISKVVKLNRTKETEFKPSGGETSMAKKIKDQQDKMQILLKQHAKHINEQLNRLNEEKSHLETILDSDNVTDLKYLDYEDLIVPTKPKETRVVNEEIVKKEEKAPEVIITTTLKPHVETTITSIQTPSTTQQPRFRFSLPPPMFTDRIKKNIITTIERNGNLTDQILKKIDKNTEILQLFLKKLTEKLEAVTTPRTIELRVEDKPSKYDMNYPPTEWNPGMHFNQNMVIRKNDSHITIPLVYAYQQPIQIPMPSHTPASVVYHGHIHTNEKPKESHGSPEMESLKMTRKIPDPNNQTRFFIDELENDYKVIQVGDVKKSRDYNMVSSNGTIS